ncbi:hypothetical protein BpHYR1_031600 [Brachionus plicatilis]|uniref:Uncharacterized protein n=1 Tax=Brachionus plicatilis TaxID=10195 RepID=A0A3M7T0H3_BRAPC|nr:hypothetical protein BpHYR1_031600 [Brachionus plicatilis]
MSTKLYFYFAFLEEVGSSLLKKLNLIMNCRVILELIENDKILEQIQIENHNFLTIHNKFKKDTFKIININDVDQIGVLEENFFTLS